jgi:hypothetical protein
MYSQREITKVKEIIQRVSLIKSEIEEEERNGKTFEKIKLLKRKLGLFKHLLVRYRANEK